MFEFFKEISYMAKNLDEETIKAEKKRLEEEDKKYGFIFPLRTRKNFFIFSFVVCIVSLIIVIFSYFYDSESENILKYVGVIFLHLAGMFCLMTKKKQGEIIYLLLVLLSSVITFYI